MRVLHWFRKDLRLDDNTALDEVAHPQLREPAVKFVEELRWRTGR